MVDILDLKKQVLEITNGYNEFNEIMEDNLSSQIELFYKQLEEKINNIKSDGKVIRLGVVGEVKAGKSSFINVMLFDGKKILPEAATPMTAALTTIKYGEKPYAKIDFYSESDWRAIESLAKQYDEEYKKIEKEIKEKRKNRESSFKINKKPQVDFKKSSKEVSKEEILSLVKSRISIEKQSCKELVEMVERKKISLNQYLGKSIEIKDNITTIDNLMGKLKEYVGADGKLTPLVKSSEVYLNLDKLKNLEVIDTPGTNDPIVSRGYITRQNLSKCDAIFLLSYSGQFMKSQDVEFIVNTLPSSGIKSGYILGSKFDSLLLDNSGNGSLKKAIVLNRKKLTSYCKEVLSNELERNPNNETLKSLLEGEDPEFISSMAYSIYKNYDNLSEEEAHILRRLSETFKEENFSRELMLDLANIITIKEKRLNQIIKNKDTIIEERLNILIDSQIKNFYEINKQINKYAKTRVESLKNGDEKELNKAYKNLNQNLKSVSSRVDDLFHKQNCDIKEKIEILKISLKDSKNKHLGIEKEKIKTNTKKVTHTERYGFLWLKKREVTDTIVTKTAQVNEVVDGISKFANEIEKSILEEFLKIVNEEKFKTDLLNEIIKVIPSNDEDFNKDEFIIPIKKVLRELRVSNIELDSSKYEKMILNEFSTSIVENEEIEKLLVKQRDIVNDIVKDVITKIDKEQKNIEEILRREGEKFIDKVLVDINMRIDEIKNQLNDKEKFIAKYENLIELSKKNIEKVKSIM